MTNDKICWDSVKYCAFKAGAITKDQYKLIKGKTDLVTPFDKRIHNANELESVPPGHILGFFGRGETEPFHVMLTTGDNKAAGNKNQCLEIGNAAEWEELDLSQLKWHEGYFIASPDAKGRDLDLIHLTPFNGLFIIKYPKNMCATSLLSSPIRPLAKPASNRATKLPPQHKCDDRTALAATQGKLHGVPCNTGAYLRGSDDWEARLTTQTLFRKAEKA